MRVAALDLGTNTFLCLIADVSDDAPTKSRPRRLLRVIDDRVKVVRLGQGLGKDSQTKKFHPEALQRAELCLTEFKKVIDQHKVDKIVAMSTSAARDVENGSELLEIGKRTGIPISIISGDQEADFSFYGGTVALNNTEGVVVVDVGGGSTELIFQEQAKIKGKSVDIGAVRLTEKFVAGHPIAVNEIEKIREFAKEKMKGWLLPIKTQTLLAVAGTPTNLAMLMQQKEKFEETAVDGFIITEKNLSDWIVKLASMTVEQRAKLPGLDPGRADVIVAGAIILEETMRLLAVSQMTVSTKGLRYGVAICT